MRKITFLVLILGLIDNGNAMFPVRDTVPHQERIDSVVTVTKQLQAGVLHGRSVTLILEEETEEGYVSNQFLKRDSDQPFFLLNLPKRMPEESQGSSINSTSSERDKPQDKLFPLIHSVVMIIMNSADALWWPLWYQPKSWKIEVMILISSSLSCSKGSYLRTPLFQRVPSVALLCPGSPRKVGSTQTSLSFRVWTYKPYTAHDQLVDLGAWNPQSFSSWKYLFIDRFHDMSQKNMSILCHTAAVPLIYADSEGNLKGLNFIIMKALSNWLKFNLQITPNTTIVEPDMYEEVRKGNRDIFINHVTLTRDRAQNFDFTVPFGREGWGVVLEVPPPLPRWQNIIYPFTFFVWGATFVSIIMTSITYHLINYKYNKSFVSNAMVVLQSILSDPMERVPTQWQVRNFLLVWWIVTWFISASYTSNLIAVLTIPVFPNRIQSVENLAASHYRLCIVNYGAFIIEALRTSKHSSLSALGDVLDLVPYVNELTYKGTELCAEKVVAGTHAHTEVYGFIVALYSRLKYNNVKTYVLQDHLYHDYMIYVLTKYTPWTYKMNEGIQKLFEAGLMQRWYYLSYKEFIGSGQVKTSSGLVALSLSHLQGPFYVYIVGLCLSLIAMMGEVLYKGSGTGKTVAANKRT